MSEAPTVRHRVRSYLQFVLAVFYYFVARALAHRGADGLADILWSPLVEQIMLVFLLLLGYSSMGFWFQRQQQPLGSQGLPRRPGFTREFAMGLACGWGIAVICVLPMAIAGGIAMVLSGRMDQWFWLISDALFFLVATLAEEIAFRGYPFQRFVESVGPLGGAIGFSAYYALVQQMIPGSSRVSFAVFFVLGLLLSTAYLRTRALWVGWGINFGWKAIRAIFFGLAVCGVSSHSSIIIGDPMGPFWLTGGGFGADGTWLAFFVILAAIPVVWRSTRELNFRYNAPVIVPAGIPVDIDAAARAQHDTAMGPAAPPPLVQIAPVTGQAIPPIEPAGNPPAAQ